MTTPPNRPSFARGSRSVAPESPEALFYALNARPTTHSYLRGPQQDVLRKYVDEAVDLPDVALELPTGTGKTLVGLLVADWRRRRSGEKVAYLGLTTQLAHQALSEASKLGLPAADLTGDRDHRSAAEVGRYARAEAVGITTYSNLFNANPVVQASNVLVLDDMHGGDEYVSQRWTVRVSRMELPSLYDELRLELRPGLSSTQWRKVTNEGNYRAVELCDTAGHPECEIGITAVLDESAVPNVRFPWLALRDHLHACVVLVSPSEIVIRPLAAPTHTHRPFADTTQRLYMSATIEDEDDIRRSYGARTIATLRAEQQPSGRRFIFVPGMYMGADDVDEFVTGIWEGLPEKRAVILAPSFAAADRSFDKIVEGVSVPPAKLSAESVAHSLEPFTSAANVILALAARYDGLDLPHDSCRLLILSDSPVALSALELYLSDNWKFGPLLRARERTRLIQGLGRCTRDATDYAVVLWLGQSLIDAATNPLIVGELPGDIHAELAWGLDQVGEYRENPELLIEMVRLILTDPAYRNEADAAVREAAKSWTPAPAITRRGTGVAEIRFARSLWDGDFHGAFEQAREITNLLTGADETGARAWWWFVASSVALRLDDKAGALECIEAALQCRVNQGFVSQTLRSYRGAALQSDTQTTTPNSEAIWEQIAAVGWSGQRPTTWSARMLSHVDEDDHLRFHEGVEMLGKALGATTTRLSEAGAPDVVWSFGENLHVTFEAKTEKLPGSLYSKSDVQEANGHPDWVRARLCEPGSDPVIYPLIVGTPTEVDQIGAPFVGDLYLVDPSEIRSFAGAIAAKLSEWRLNFFGRDFAACESEFSAAVRLSGADTASIVTRMTARKLQD
ncbi:MAG: DEAD/DEAH box helicase [Dehalococcoidia bacterium]